MNRKRRRLLICMLTACLGTAVFAGGSQRKKNEEPKTQVLPLPKELPMALEASTQSLDFHISPLLRSGRLSAQIRESLTALIRDTRGETIVKLRAFVAGAGDARRVQALVSELFSEKRLPFPVLSIVQVGALGDEASQVVIEAVVATKKNLNPHGLAFWAGQTGPSFKTAFEQLQASVREASVSHESVLSCTCFTSRLTGYAQMVGEIRSAFPKTEVNVVQALRGPADDTTTCEAIGQLSETWAEGPVVRLRSARATVVSAHDLVFTGMQLTFGNYLDDAQQAFDRLQRAAAAIDAAETPVTINAFSLDVATASALRKTLRVPPSVFTVQPVEGLPAVDASAGVEAVLAARVASAVDR